MSETPQAVDPAELPEIITSYLKAHQVRDLGAAMQSYEPAARVTDEGRTYHGPAEIRAWLSRSASEYIYTIEMTGATKIGDARYDVTHHLEGNFPEARPTFTSASPCATGTSPGSSSSHSGPAHSAAHTIYVP
jgi:hypothetical protein